MSAYFRGKHKLFGDSFVDELINEPSFHAELCSSSTLREACELTRGSYGDAYVSCEVAEQWRIKNPRGFVQIMNQDNRFCAAFGVFALRQSFMDQFVAGKVSDSQMSAEDICSWDESQDCARLYLSGVVVANKPSKSLGSKRTWIMIWVMLDYMRQLYGLRRPRTIYAVAVTKESHDVMKNLGFVVEMTGFARNDHCDLYKFELTEESWRKMLTRVGDNSLTCRCEFELERRSDASACATLPIKLLFVVGDRGAGRESQVQGPKEYESIKEGIERSKYREHFQLVSPLFGATRQSLVRGYKDHPTIVHFAGHGHERSLSFILEQGIVVSETEMLASQLSSILGSFEPRVRLCVLNACNSEPIAKHLAAERVVEAAIGWPVKLTDASAISFSRTLYGALADGLRLKEAVTLASESVDDRGQRAMLFTSDEIDPSTIILVSSR